MVEGGAGGRRQVVGSRLGISGGAAHKVHVGRREVAGSNEVSHVSQLPLPSCHPAQRVKDRRRPSKPPHLALEMRKRAGVGGDAHRQLQVVLEIACDGDTGRVEEERERGVESQRSQTRARYGFDRKRCTAKMRNAIELYPQPARTTPK